MHTSLDHLPKGKQQELQQVTKAIRYLVNVEKIILFGSYARGDYVDRDVYRQNGIIYEYRSDFDILVIVKNQKKEEDYRLWQQVDDRLGRNNKIKTPVSVIVDNIDAVNTQLSDGRYFFVDIQNEGILLFDSGKHTLKKPRKLTAAERKKFATEYYDMWMGKATDTLELYEFCLAHQKKNLAAFNLHQATEALLTSYLLVRTDYRPKTHDLKKLLGHARQLDERFIAIFPDSTPIERRQFLLLCKAYVDARYEKSYTITHEELVALRKEMERLQALVESLCQEVIGG